MLPSAQHIWGACEEPASNPSYPSHEDLQTCPSWCMLVMEASHYVIMVSPIILSIFASPFRCKTAIAASCLALQGLVLRHSRNHSLISD